MATLKLVRELNPDYKPCGRIFSNRKYITKIVIAETGEVLSGIQSVEYTEDADKNRGLLKIGTTDFEIDVNVDKK